MGTFFGILAIIQGLVFVVISFGARGRSNESPVINFLLGIFFMGIGSAMMG